MKKRFMKPLLALYFCSAFGACKKGADSPSPVNPNPTNPNPANPYYFNFRFDGTQYNFASEQPEYMSAYDHTAGGYQQQTFLYPSIGLAFRYDHVVTDAEVRALSGKTLHFNDTNPKPELTFDLNSSANTEYAVDTPAAGYSVNVQSVTFLRVDTTIFNKVDVYVIKGTCNAVMENGSTSRKPLTNGDFNFLISRVKQ